MSATDGPHSPRQSGQSGQLAPLAAAALLSTTAHAVEFRHSIQRITLDDARRPGVEFPIPLPAEWRRLAETFVGKKPDSTTLAAAADSALAHLAANDFPAVSIAAAAERGTLRLEIAPSVIREVILDAGPASTRHAVARDWSALVGKDARWSTLEAALDWLHRNPLRAATLRLAEADDGANVVVRLDQSRAFRASAAWANDGIEPLSEHRLSLGVEAADLGGISSHLAAHAAFSPDPDEYQFYRAGVRIFLPWRHEWNVVAALVRAETASDSLRTWQLGTRYVVPFYPAPGWTFDLGAGLDFRRTENDRHFAGLHIESAADTAQLALEMKLRHVSPTGEEGIYAVAIHSPGGWSGDASDTRHGALRPGAEAAYWLARTGAWATRRFAKWSLSAQAHAQFSDAATLPAEQLALGGSTAVRGFDEVSQLVDSGAWGSMELRAPAVARLESSVFADAGTGHDRVDGHYHTIAAAGFGLRTRWRELSLRAQYAWRLTEPGGRLHLSAQWDF